MHCIWEGDQSETMLIMYGLSLVSLPPHIVLAREGFRICVGQFSSSKGPKTICRYARQYLTAIVGSRSLLIVPVCSQGHWGIIVVDAVMDKNSGRR